MSRVYNMNCLLKKIKAKFLKYVFIKVKKAFAYIKINIKKIDQIKEVRNLNIKHNRDNFINLKIVDVLINNNLITKEDSIAMLEHANHEVVSILNMKIKYFYQFNFLKSNYFKEWLKDPIKIKNIGLNNNSSSITMVKNGINNSKTISKHSKNIFKAHPEDHEKYKRLLLHTYSNFIFYFQNDPLKYGKKIM